MKFLIKEESDRFRIVRIKRGSRSMATLDSCLYRTDDALFSRDPKTSDAYLQYRVSSTQPVLIRPEYIPTEETRIWILSGKIAGNKKSRILNIDPNRIMAWFPPIIIALVLLWFGLKQVGL